MIATVVTGTGFVDKGNSDFVEMPLGTTLHVPAGENYRIINADSRYIAIVFCLYPNTLGGMITEVEEFSFAFTPTGRRPRFRQFNGSIVDLQDDLEKPGPNEPFKTHTLVESPLITMEAVYIRTQEEFQLHTQSSIFVSVILGRMAYQFAGGSDPQSINIREGSYAVLGRCIPYKFTNLGQESDPVLILKTYGPALADGDVFSPGEVDCYTTEAPTASPSAAYRFTRALAAAFTVVATAVALL